MSCREGIGDNDLCFGSRSILEVDRCFLTWVVGGNLFVQYNKSGWLLFHSEHSTVSKSNLGCTNQFSGTNYRFSELVPCRMQY